MTVTTRSVADSAGNALKATGQWRGLLALGVATVTLGIVLSVWPEATLHVLAVVVAIQFLVNGVISIVGAVVATAEEDTVIRVLLAVTGMVAVILGLVCLRAPQQTVVLLGLILGMWWVFKGLMEMIRALGGAPSATPRGLVFGIGLLTSAAGAFLLLNPHVTLTILLVVVEVWLFGFGFLTIVAAMAERAAERRSGTLA